MGAGEDRDPDRVRVLLDRGLDDLLGQLMEARVDHLHAGVASARAITFAPRSCPSRPTFAITTLTGLLIAAS